MRNLISGMVSILCVIFATVQYLVLSVGAKPPNVVFVVADDLGWDDVGYHGSTQVKTPNIDSFASRSIVLDSHYVNSLCSPSRASLLTGRYASSLGLQHSVILQGQRLAVPLNESLLSEYLRPKGYATHAIGKWHLGYFATAYTPTGRGFDTFYGLYNENADYYDHSSSLDFVLMNKYNAAWGLDWRMDQNGSFDLIYDDFGKYSTDILTDRAIEVSQNYSGSEQPFFMYLAYQAVHSGNEDDPLQAPRDDVNLFPNIYDNRRRKQAAMIYNLDKNFGRLIQSLEEEGHLNNTFILFLTDNGGPTLNCDFSWASNYPLRGSKHTLYEGGVRGVALAYTPQVIEGSVNNHMVHVSDWVPTVLEAVGIDVPEHLDGVSQYQSLLPGAESARSELLLNIDQRSEYSALRVQEMKLIVGEYHNYYAGCLHHSGWPTPPGSTPTSSYVTPNPTVQCSGEKPSFWDKTCWSDDLNMKACMFNLTADPCEYRNIIDVDELEDTRSLLFERFNYYYYKAVPVRWPLPDITAMPPLHNFTWVPWTNDTTMWA